MVGSREFAKNRMKTKIFCIFFAVLCLVQSSVALKCYTCYSCSEGHNETTCADGEVCSTMNFIAQLYGRTEESSYKSCVPAGTTCEQQKQEPDFKAALDMFDATLRVSGGSFDATCEYCSDKDFCNN